MCMSISHIHIHIHALPAHLAPCGDPGTGLTDSCKLPCGYWKLNPGLLASATCSYHPVISPAPYTTSLYFYYFGYMLLLKIQRA